MVVHARPLRAAGAGGYDHTGIRVSALHEVDSNGDGAWDQRIQTDYLNDPHNHTGYSQILRETHYDAGTGALRKTIDYTIGLDEIAQTTTTYDAQGNIVSRETLIFGHDGHASVRVLFDLAGAIAQLYVYEAYGQLAALYNAAGQFVSANPTDAWTSLLYTGEHFDVRIQLEYLRQRWYDPTNGRFNRLDPFFGNLWEPQSFHKYLFTHADPINGTDPTGRFTSMLASAGIYGVSEVTWTVVTGAVITTVLLTGVKTGFLLWAAGLVLVANGEVDFGFYLYNLGTQIAAFSFEVIDGLGTAIGLGQLAGALIGGGVALAERAPGLADELFGAAQGLVRKPGTRLVVPARARGITGVGEGITDAQAEAMYAAIRRMRGDVRRVSQATGVPEDVVRAVRQHVFLDTHEIAVAPNQTVRMRFDADPVIAELWTRAAGKGEPLTADEVALFRRIIAHEYVERALMRHGGMPYRSADPAAWVFERGEWTYYPTPEALGAHDLAPLTDLLRPPWEHYPSLGLGQPGG